MPNFKPEKPGLQAANTRVWKIQALTTSNSAMYSILSWTKNFSAKGMREFTSYADCRRLVETENERSLRTHQRASSNWPLEVASVFDRPCPQLHTCNVASTLVPRTYGKLASAHLWSQSILASPLSNPSFTQRRFWLLGRVGRGLPKRPGSSPRSPGTPLSLAYPKFVWPLTGLPKWKRTNRPAFTAARCHERKYTVKTVISRKRCKTWLR